MADWSTISSLATAGGTLVLAVATFASVRSANRAARVAERSFDVGLRPLLMPSRLEDPGEKIMWGDGHWAQLSGGRATVETGDQVIYLAIPLRNAGNGIGVLQGWRAHPEMRMGDISPSPVDQFRRQTRDLYIPVGSVSFWQGTLRSGDGEIYEEMLRSVKDRRAFRTELLYSDHEGGQCAISLFNVVPRENDGWLCSVVRHWSLGRLNPR
jgi:hypothetical protein